MAFNNISFFKILGIFSTSLILLIFFSGVVIGLVNAVRTGDWSEALKSTGGRLFSVDYALKEETDYLLNTTLTDEFIVKSNYVFHFCYGLILLFVLFVIFYGLYRFGNWLIGIKQFSPSSDLIIIALLGILYFVLEFLYVQFVLKTTIIPLKDGVWYFLKNTPEIAHRLFT